MPGLHYVYGLISRQSAINRRSPTIQHFRAPDECQSCRPLPMSAPRLSTRPVATGGGAQPPPPRTNLSPP